MWLVNPQNSLSFFPYVPYESCKVCFFCLVYFLKHCSFRIWTIKVMPMMGRHVLLATIIDAWWTLTKLYLEKSCAYTIFQLLFCLFFFFISIIVRLWLDTRCCFVTYSTASMWRDSCVGECVLETLWAMAACSLYMAPGCSITCGRCDHLNMTVTLHLSHGEIHGKGAEQQSACQIVWMINHSVISCFLQNKTH